VWDAPADPTALADSRMATARNLKREVRADGRELLEGRVCTS
jgi:hypothetical protein